ncbi:hypothetical protein L7F22_049241 [Adiantum nelumboides]|nr:hypothetical protein [Adiantum nelumboides]
MARGKALMAPLPSYVKLSNQDCPQPEAKNIEMDKVSYASACGSALCYGSQDLSVKGYSDSYYARDLDKRRSTSGFVFTLAGGAISWQSQLQDCITQSTIEAKYVVANEACKEAIWLGRLVAELGIKVDMPELY